MMGLCLQRRIDAICYDTFQPSPDAQPQDSLKITLANGEVARVPNTGFSDENPALCLMAYLGVSPSTLDDAVGESLPIQLTHYGAVVPDFVLNNGRRCLHRSAWFDA